MASNEYEETQIRRALEHIISSDPDQAPYARHALEALSQPETTPEGRQARNRRESGARRIVNGIPTRGYPAVGALLQGNDPRTARAWCTGTLVGCDQLLTAAHCIADHPSPNSYLVFFQELGFFEVKEILWEPAEYSFPYFDLAMLTLKKPVEGIAPMAINMRVAPLTKSPATIVGFGRTGGMRYDYGIKREGSVKTEACPAAYANQQVLCWSFDADVKPGESASNTCNADSGGGIFMRDKEGPRVVEKVFGVVSGGQGASNCVKNDLSFNVDVFQYRTWINTAGAGRLSSQMCGSPLWERKEAEPQQWLFSLNNKIPEASVTLNVSEGTAALRVAMNGEDDGTGKNDFNLLVFRGARAAGSEPECHENGSGQFAFCEITHPAQGTWTIVVTRKQGEGDAQVTATVVRGSRP
jgi:hypothetical protein